MIRYKKKSMISYYITCILNMYVNYVQLIQVGNIHSAYKTYTIYTY